MNYATADLAWEGYLFHKRENHRAKLRAAAFRRDGDRETAARFSAKAATHRTALNRALGIWHALSKPARKAA